VDSKKYRHFLDGSYGSHEQYLHDLNTAHIETDAGLEPLQDFSTISDDGKVRVFFKNLEDHLIQYIRKADIVVGCVAWLTSPRILKALSKVKGVSVVVQKEDFLRPDSNPGDNWRKWLNDEYDKLPIGPTRYCYTGTVVSSLSIATDATVFPVRCVGNHNSQSDSAFPRSHHKFVVFCKLLEVGCPDGFTDITITPYAVWTGSFNFSKTASASFENSVVITDTKIVLAYYKEWGQVFALSEPLNWEREWVAPEYRIGT
jgi:hypothetical protein